MQTPVSTDKLPGIFKESHEVTSSTAPCIGLLRGALAALAFCGTAPVVAQGLVATRGPFTLELVEKRSGPQLNANLGFVRVRYYETRLLHRGKPLSLRDAEGRNQTEFTDVFILSDAPEPALLVGSNGWQLVIERDGKPVVRALTTDPVGTVHWTDGPAAERRTEAGRTRTEAPESLELKGKRLLLLDQRAALDLGALEVRALDGRQKENPGATNRPDPTAIPPEYKVALSEPLGLSPDRGALAQLYRGDSNSPRDALIVITSVDGRGERCLLPLDLKEIAGPRDFPDSA